MMQWKTVMCGALSLAAGVVLAQQPGAATSKSASDLEPAVNTSAPAPTAAPARAQAQVPASAPTPGAVAKAATGTTATTVQAKPAPAAPGAAAKPAGKSLDRLELEATQITGNRELPRVMYVVPWRRADLGDLMGRPANSLLDEALTPVDRDVFRRQSQYYEALQPDQAGAAPGPAK